MSNENELYIVTVAKTELVVQVLGLERDVPLKWSDGMIGAMPVFNKYDDALRYAGGDKSLVVDASFVKMAKLG